MRNFVRIVGGKWRSRRLQVPRVRTVRPTPDRVRETVFNWLDFRVQGARVVDLFAGSGALGFECLSRGAAHVTFVDINRAVVERLRGSCQQLDLEAEHAAVVRRDALRWLVNESSDLDLAFVDPPFDEASMRNTALASLRNRIRPDGLVYVEYSKHDSITHAGWERWKTSEVGDVAFALLRLTGDTEIGS